MDDKSHFGLNFEDHISHRYTISNVLKRSGIVVDKHVEGRKNKTEEVIRLYVDEKKSVKQISEMFGVCDGTIYKCLKRNNIYTKRTRWDYEKKTMKRGLLLLSLHSVSLLAS